MHDEELAENKVTEITRRNIFDYLSIQRIYWSGRLDETNFLARLFDLHTLPSTDTRFQNAFGDIWQHRINNNDWEDDWIFTDSRFSLLRCKDELFLKFLCEVIHPVVRPDSDEATRICEEFNNHLKHDGYHIAETTRISGKPVFTAKELIHLRTPSLETAKQSFKNIDESYLSQQITRMETAIVPDPGLAIGTAKELIETICKTVIVRHGESYPDNSKIPNLVRQTTKLLKLTPDSISNEIKAAQTIKSILGSLAIITQGMAELRNSYGTGHGKEAGTKGLTTRHARLVVGAATTLAVFLWDTYIEKQDQHKY
ncbi:abortive infection family protein [Desulfovibrio sulfodismutans]|uniref:Abortive infection family protein n=1 Tax=Desulfolutivibrio sulfodismutans TaxID=63561 RepID=A0A7K3NML7_9BACT|nr:abortive infection family protein [Desulfolutivibrio sulfodismutans]NDY57441.1 abortive infection family protein [Desulfolutivibrio sulfodismutans]QLA11922.1 hypothetical protein GD606_06420 [Desulfolutivibrio sulfodismutans DSM 3696]